MRIAIIGPGAVGCLLAASFQGAGEEVFLVDYRPERAAILRAQGIRLRTLAGDQQTLLVPCGLPSDAGPRELVVVAVKAHQTKEAARALPDLLAPGGIALSLQNGLGNLEDLTAVVGPEPLLAGVTFLGVTRQGEGEILYAGRGSVLVGAPPGSRVVPDKIGEVAALFTRAGFDCQAREDIQAFLWEKMLINVGINPLTALLQVANGALLELPEAWELAVAAATETQAVARAAGIEVPGDPAQRLRQVCTATAANRSSMLQDVLAGRGTEIEALNGQVVARGAALGVPTPVNHFLTQLLRALGQSTHWRVG